MATVTIIGGSDTGALTGSGASRTSDTKSVTVPTSGELNKCFVYVGFGNVWNSATLGGVAATGVVSGLGGSCQNYNMAYWLNPPTGINNVVVNWTGATGSTMAYRGITLQDVLSLDVTDWIDNPGSTSVSKAITTTANGDLVMASIVGTQSAALANTWSATNIMVGQSCDYGFLSWSYLPQTSAGSITGSYSWTGSACPVIHMMSFKYAAPPATNGNFLSLM